MLSMETLPKVCQMLTAPRAPQFTIPVALREFVAVFPLIGLAQLSEAVSQRLQQLEDEPSNAFRPEIATY